MSKEEKLAQLNAMNIGTLMQTIGIEYTDLGEGFLTAKMPVNATVYQPMQILHGGATAALAETVGSAASMVYLQNSGKVSKGLELSINHLKSVSSGDVFATAKIIHKGRTTHLWEVRVTDTDGNLISLAKLTNIVLDKR